MCVLCFPISEFSVCVCTVVPVVVVVGIFLDKDSFPFPPNSDLSLIKIYTSSMEHLIKYPLVLN